MQPGSLCDDGIVDKSWVGGGRGVVKDSDFVLEQK